MVVTAFVDDLRGEGGCSANSELSPGRVRACCRYAWQLRASEYSSRFRRGYAVILEPAHQRQLRTEDVIDFYDLLSKVESVAPHKWHIDSRPVSVPEGRQGQLRVDILYVRRSCCVELCRRDLGRLLCTSPRAGVMLCTNRRQEIAGNICLRRKNWIKISVGDHAANFFREKEECLFLVRVVDARNE